MGAVFKHSPVLAAEVLLALEPVPTGLVVDATLGGAGHARMILESRPDVELLGIDRDATALEAARETLLPYSGRVRTHQGAFDDLRSLLDQHGIDNVVGVLLDLGVSSPQLDVAERGFSYHHTGDLDMRMDQSQDLTAGHVVNHWSALELARALRTHGDERFSRRIAQAIVIARPIESTTELAQIIAEAVPARARAGKHPARRSFQALRVLVNDEHGQLERVLDQALDCLDLHGRCLVITYHSGEDRVVKRRFRSACDTDANLPPGMPIEVEKHAEFVYVPSVGRGGATPTRREIDENARSRSARLRCIERVSTLSRHPSTNIGGG